MEILWHGNTCFTVKGKTADVVIDPTNGLKLKGDLVLSGLSDGSEVTGSVTTFDWPGEYECKDIPVVAMGNDELIFCFEVEGVRFCHARALSAKLDSEMINAIGDVDILMVEHGPKANELTESIEPRVVIPMGDDDMSSFLKNVGMENVENMDKFVVKSRSDLPEDKQLYIVLQKSL